MKTKFGTLVDRFVTADGELRVKVQSDSGIETVSVSADDRDEAASIRGGGPVRFTRSGSTWRYVNDAEFYGEDE